MTTQTYTRLELAENQLRAAIGLFVTSGDRFSVISLAGAADVLLARLVLNTGKENFTDRLLAKHREKSGALTETRESYGKAINDTLFINQLKHMDDEDDGFVEMDPEECALAAILKALANHIHVPGHDPDLVTAFKAWVRANLDPNKYNVECNPDWNTIQ